MGGIVRFLVILLIGYLILRRLIRWWKEDQPQGRGKRRGEPPPFQDQDVLDAEFTEIPNERKPTEERSEK